MIPVRKDWYLGGGGSFSFCSFIKQFFLNNLFGGGGGGGNRASIAVFVACQHLLSYITIFKYCSLNDFVV